MPKRKYRLGEETKRERISLFILNLENLQNLHHRAPSGTGLASDTLAAERLFDALVRSKLVDFRYVELNSECGLEFGDEMDHSEGIPGRELRLDQGIDLGIVRQFEKIKHELTQAVGI